MHGSGFDLLFGPNTSKDCQDFVQKLPADAILRAYRDTRAAYGTNDIALVLSDQTPDIMGGPRKDCAQHLRQVMGRRALELGIHNSSAQSIASLPSESEAMWLVLDIRRMDLPIMCVVYAVPYEFGEVASG